MNELHRAVREDRFDRCGADWWVDSRRPESSLKGPVASLEANAEVEALLAAQPLADGLEAVWDSEPAASKEAA